MIGERDRWSPKTSGVKEVVRKPASSPEDARRAKGAPR
jgi:hypothetical protein